VGREAEAHCFVDAPHGEVLVADGPRRAEVEASEQRVPDRAVVLRRAHEGGGEALVLGAGPCERLGDDTLAAGGEDEGVGVDRQRSDVAGARRIGVAGEAKGLGAEVGPYSLVSRGVEGPLDQDGVCVRLHETWGHAVNSVGFRMSNVQADLDSCGAIECICSLQFEIQIVRIYRKCLLIKISRFSGIFYGSLPH
jgi:hypothetical protein